MLIEEEERSGGFDLVDTMDIPIAMTSFSESDEYPGAHKIATVTLGYNFATNQTCNVDENEGKNGPKKTTICCNTTKNNIILNFSDLFQASGLFSLSKKNFSFCNS